VAAVSAATVDIWAGNPTRAIGADGAPALRI